MKLLFLEIKKIILTCYQDYLINIDFIYSGDVIKSEELKFSKKLNHTSHSSIFVSEIMCEIYNWSFNKMIEKSKELNYNLTELGSFYGVSRTAIKNWVKRRNLTNLFPNKINQYK
mgnify:CR=1 FL=1